MPVVMDLVVFPPVGIKCLQADLLQILPPVGIKCLHGETRVIIIMILPIRVCSFAVTIASRTMRLILPIHVNPLIAGRLIVEARLVPLPLVRLRQLIGSVCRFSYDRNPIVTAIRTILLRLLLRDLFLATWIRLPESVIVVSMSCSAVLGLMSSLMD